MDFPLFHLDVMGNRMLIAIIAVVHVVISHAMAVGAYPLITMLEWIGIRSGDRRYDDVARKMTFVVFVITTSVGALTGVGIWFSTTVVGPAGIGSLLRVFFWAWFAEWLVFVAEVGLVLAYYLTWKRWQSGGLKRAHLGIGIALSIMSWFTMAIIVGILGFMMSTDQWDDGHQFWSAFLNRVYVPQLLFRTAFAMIGAGLFAWFLVVFLTPRDRVFRHHLVRWIAGWTLVWLPVWLGSAFWYWGQVPEGMAKSIDVALMTSQFAEWSRELGYLIAASVGLVAVISVAGVVRPAWVPRVALIVPFLLSVWMFGHFERAREFVRKPYVIADYLYANGVRTSDLPIYQREGMLRYAAFASVHEVTEENRLVAGREVFMLACSRCHTTDGVNGVLKNFEGLYGEQVWRDEDLGNFVRGMHLSRPYMPPFPGNDAEREALVAYVQHLRAHPESIDGAQEAGVPASPGGEQDMTPLLEFVRER